MTEPNTSLAQLVEAFRAKLDASNDDGLAGALSLLMSSLDAAGVCLVEWSPGHEPIVIAVTGLIQDISQQADFRALEPRVLQHASEAFTRHVEGPPDYWLTAIPWRAGGQLVLVTWGDLADSPDLEVVLPNLLALIGKCLSIVQARREPAAPARHLVFPEGYVEGTSPALRELHSRMEPLLQGDLPVLIVGETGVGKEFVARTLHSSSKRAKGPFIAINCAAIPSELLEAELFGIVRGTATGVSERLGKFQQADGGSVFLDEIGDMSSELQAKFRTPDMGVRIYATRGA